MEGEDYVFMDMATYEETRLSADQIGESRKYLKEGMEVNVVSWNDTPWRLNCPTPWFWRSKKPTLASKATPLPVALSPPFLRPVHK